MNRSRTSDLLNLLVFQKYAAYLTLMLPKIEKFPNLAKVSNYSEAINKWTSL